MIRSYSALVLGAMFAAGTGYVLFHDVTTIHDITIDHVMTGLVLVGTIAAGHFFWPQVRAWRLLPAIGVAVLFVAGTGYCLVSSAGRQGASADVSALNIRADNEARSRIEADLTEAKQLLRDAITAEVALDACGGKEGGVCKSRRKTREERQAKADALEEKLRLRYPARVEHPELHHAAKVIAELPYVSAGEDLIFAKLVLFTPVAKAVFLELATLVFLGIALGHPATPTAANAQGIATTRLVAQPVRISSQLALPPPRDPIEQLMIDALGKASRPLSNEELAAEIGVTPGAASKIRQRVSDKVRVARNGRELAISLAD